MLGLLSLLFTVTPIPALDQAVVGSLPATEYEPADDSVISMVPQTASHPAAMDDFEALQVSSEGLEQTAILFLGWVEVEPNTEYLARYYVKPEHLVAPANMYLQIRERASQDGPPIQPYPRESVRHREVHPEQTGMWVERRMRFTTTEETQWLEVRLVIAELNGDILLSDFDLIDSQRHAERVEAQGGEKLDALLQEIRDKAATREPLLETPLVFSRGQIKYGLDRSFYEHEYEWLDRPLFMNRDYGIPMEIGFGPSYLFPMEADPKLPRRHVVPLESYIKTMQELGKYGIDGMAFFPQSRDRMGLFEMAERTAQQPGLEQAGLLPEFLANQDMESYRAVLERALDSPVTPRIGDRVLITSYGAAGNSPEEWDEILTELRDRYGDAFVFLPALTAGVSLRGPYRDGNYEEFVVDLEETRDFLRAYLAVSDGIYFNYPPALRVMRTLPRPFDRDFYEEVFIPVWRELLTDPEYKDKYLGLSAYKSHMMPERGNNLHQDGTRTIRNSFEPAMEARPDVIILPEWDEQNENTSWRPTMYDSTTSQRIIRYYMSQIRGEDPSPVPGDDEAIPNLILSIRKILSLGEEAVIELLNVPDSAESQSYKVTLLLRDQDGDTLAEYGPFEFDSAALQEERILVPTEQFPQATALVPALKIEGYKGRDWEIDQGLPHAKLRATWNWNHLYQKQPLRMLLQPEEFDFQITAETDEEGFITVQGKIEADEPLALVEVVGDDKELYTVDPADEWHRNDPDRTAILLVYRSMEPEEISGTLTLENATAEWAFQSPMLHRRYPEMDLQDGVLTMRSESSAHNRWIYLSIPNDELDDAVIDFDFDKLSFKLPVREVLEKGMIVKEDGGALRVAVSPFHRQIDLPAHLDTEDVEFEARVVPHRPDEQFHVRITTKSGKSFRSAPLGLAVGEEPTREIVVYSEKEERPVALEVAASRVPVLEYEFNPEVGAVLLTDGGSIFSATLGGYVSMITGRGATSGMHRRDYPYPVVPEWVEDEGRPALRFDGEGMFIKLPLETLPRRTAYSVEFEIKPAEGETDYPLLMNRISGRQKGLALNVVEGKLQATFRPEDWNVERFETDLEVPSGEWSKIKVVYDYDQIRFFVNDEEAAFPFSKPGANNGYTMIGDGWNRVEDSYHGLFRDLVIRHHP